MAGVVMVAPAMHVDDLMDLCEALALQPLAGKRAMAFSGRSTVGRSTLVFFFFFFSLLACRSVVLTMNVVILRSGQPRRFTQPRVWRSTPWLRWHPTQAQRVV